MLAWSGEEIVMGRKNSHKLVLKSFVKQRRSKEHHEHFDLAEGCSALELVPASWLNETTHFRNGYSAPGARTLFSYSVFSTLFVLKQITCLSVLALTEAPQRTWRSHLTIVSLAFRKAITLAGATEGF